MAEPLQTKIINIPDRYNSAQRIRIAQDIIAWIRERTSSGLDVNNRAFAGYSSAYEKSGTVNLRLSGDMLAGLELLSHGKGFLRIGFTNADANDKAAYIQAPRGEKRGKQPKRTFVGISQGALNRILERYPL